MNAQCMSVTYKAGEYENIQSYSRQHPNYLNSFREDNYNVTDRGNGWATKCKSSRLILTVYINNDIQEIWIDRYFKNNLGRLTKKRQDLIRNTMPETVNVEQKQKRNGENYFVVSEKDLSDWLQRI